MYPAKFDYYRADSVDEAISLLQEHGSNAKLLAGGHSLLPMMKLRLAQPPVLIDIGRISELKGITPTRDGGVEIGAMTTYADVAANDWIRENLPALHDVCSIIGDMQVRNRGTIGGNLSHNDPASDLPAVALALNAELTIRGPDGSRTLSADDFNVGLMETALTPNEIVTSIRFPAVHPGREGAPASAYVKFENPASGYAICGVAAALDVRGEGQIKEARVAVTGAADHAERLGSVEAALQGVKPDDEEAISAACEQAGEGLFFMSDIHADEDYRAHLTRVLARRAVQKALERARS